MRAQVGYPLKLPDDHAREGPGQSVSARSSREPLAGGHDGQTAGGGSQPVSLAQRSAADISTSAAGSLTCP